MSNPTATLPPGFRFHPTDEELILHYLRRRAAFTVSPVPLIADVDIYKFNPWDLPCKAMFGEKEWYFFSPRDRKYPNGVRPNRAAASGYWKATGTDKPIHATSAETAGDHHHQIIGVKKALVFYKGKPPKGLKTNWIMHEYRLISHPDHQTPNIIHTSFKPPVPFKDSSMRLDDWVLCRIYKKNNHHMSPERDQQEESVLMTSTTATVHGLHKSSSLSELLNQLFDNPSEIFGFLDDDLQLLNSGNTTHVTKHGASVSENPQKRLLEDGGGFQQPNFKKLNSSCFTNHQNGLMMISQPFLNPHIVLNSQLGLH